MTQKNYLIMSRSGIVTNDETTNTRLMMINRHMKTKVNNLSRHLALHEGELKFVCPCKDYFKLHISQMGLSE